MSMTLFTAMGFVLTDVCKFLLPRTVTAMFRLVACVSTVLVMMPFTLYLWVW